MATRDDQHAGNGARIVVDAACTACSCVCDDIELTIDSRGIVDAARACTRGSAWFLQQSPNDRPSCLVDGQPATLAAGVERAARILAAARYPLIYGLNETSSETQRVAVGIADWIGGNVDTTTSTRHGPSGVAFQGVGEVTCSLGEIANRGDTIIFWRADPAVSHPRHFERYSLFPQGMFVPNGRRDRTCVVVDVCKTQSAEAADLFIPILPDKDFEAFWTMRALANGLELDAAEVELQTGVPLAVWRDLVALMKRAKFGVLLFGVDLSTARGKHVNSEALLGLVRDMNAYTRFVARPMREPGNAAGADNVICWQTGYPFGVNLSRGYPRYNPGEYTAAEMLERGEVDAAMIVASDPAPHFSAAALAHLAAIPSITLDFKETPATRAAQVAFTTATYGIHVPGTVYRMDDVPLPLRPAIDASHPSDFDVLQHIERRVRELKNASNL